MSISLPNAADAKSATIANNTAAVNAANTSFIAATMVLIDNADKLGFMGVVPFITKNLDISYITSYFQGLGYIVVHPYHPKNLKHYGRPRILIAWPNSANNDFLLLETEFLFELEGETGFILLE